MLNSEIYSKWVVGTISCGWKKVASCLDNEEDGKGAVGSQNHQHLYNIWPVLFAFHCCKVSVLL